MNIAETLAEYLQELSDEHDGLTDSGMADAIIDHLNSNYKDQILQHKFTHSFGEWTAILVFKDSSAIKLHSSQEQFDIYVGDYNKLRGH